MAGFPNACIVATLGVCVSAMAVEIPIDSGRVPIWPELRIVAPADRNASPEQAAKLAGGSRALGVDSPDRILGRGMLPYWALFSLQNPERAAQMRMLALESTTQYDTRLFNRDAGGRWQPVNSIAEESGGKVGGGTINPVWALTLAPNITADFLLRIEGPSVVRFPLFAYTPVAYSERTRQTDVTLGFALGSCLFIALYILYLHRLLEDRSVPLFLWMLAGDLVGALWLSGALAAFFPALPENVIGHVGFAGFSVLFGVGCLHAREYLNTAAWSQRADRSLLVSGWAWFALAPWFMPVFPVAARILLVWGGTVVALGIVAAAILASRRKGSMSGFIAAAWVSNVLMGLYFAIVRAIDNPLIWSPSSLALIQATVMAIFFGFAMSQRLVGQRVVLAAHAREAELQREKVAALVRERSLLFAATNHDLRQPLLGVGLFAELLKSARTDEERQEHARKLGLAIAEVDGLLIGIQQLAAVHEASIPPPLESASLDDLLMPIVAEYRNRAESKRITIRYVPTRLKITTHPPYFQRIVRNVLSNAIRYTVSGDRILVGCRRAGGLHIVIADSGRGMTEDQAARAFDAFQRFDTDKSVPDGFGLGLFSVRTLAHALGHVVTLQSQSGGGTRFRMFVPLA